MEKARGLAPLAKELLALESETFEIQDYEEVNDAMLGGCTSTSSCSTCSSTTSTTSCSA